MNQNLSQHKVSHLTFSTTVQLIVTTQTILDLVTLPGRGDTEAGSSTLVLIIVTCISRTRYFISIIPAVWYSITSVNVVYTLSISALEEVGIAAVL